MPKSKMSFFPKLSSENKESPYIGVLSESPLNTNPSEHQGLFGKVADSNLCESSLNPKRSPPDRGGGEGSDKHVVGSVLIPGGIYALRFLVLEINVNKTFKDHFKK